MERLWPHTHADALHPRHDPCWPTHERRHTDSEAGPSGVYGPTAPAHRRACRLSLYESTHARERARELEEPTQACGATVGRSIPGLAPGCRPDRPETIPSCNARCHGHVHAASAARAGCVDTGARRPMRRRRRRAAPHAHARSSSSSRGSDGIPGAAELPQYRQGCDGEADAARRRSGCSAVGTRAAGGRRLAGACTANQTRQQLPSEGVLQQLRAL
mmetsp:Transcript_8793/g.26687  ORF Transcript_8793/g.26687 Transcript_8793/m.26687 type:complete len:217 (+) Transcript_8793:151-801(+)